MELDHLKMVINEDGFFTDKEYQSLKMEYYKLFTKMYGKDISTVLLSVLRAERNAKLFSKILNNSENYQKAIEALEQIKPTINKERLKMLMVYQSNELIAAARIRNINDKVGSIPDAVFMTRDDEIKEIWAKMIKFVEQYFISLGYEKMYIEVPLSNPILLKNCFDFNFKEDSDDIVVSESTKTYLLNKRLERRK